jgi:hypothetical protein
MMAEIKVLHRGMIPESGMLAPSSCVCFGTVRGEKEKQGCTRDVMILSLNNGPKRDISDGLGGDAEVLIA